MSDKKRTITVEVHSIPEEQRYRTDYGDLPVYVEVSIGAVGKMVAPVAHCPNPEKAQLIAAALQRWADADPAGLDAAIWAIRDHR